MQPWSARIDIIGADGAGGWTLLAPGSPVIPGYNHLDLLTAAPVQNDGRPERVVTELLEFLFRGGPSGVGTARAL